ncbi:MAG: hypothetical protein KAS07_03490 [Candidatus Pacebacteria bacterium]|nr:hypothetical protein [Candidatus Paceibacterota bacterium]
MQNKIIFILLIIIVVISIVGSMLFMNKNSSSDPDQDDVYLPVSNEGGGIEITDPTLKNEILTTITKATTSKEKESEAILYTGIKKPGNVIVIDIVNFVKNGYIVIYENTFEPTGEILGTSSFLRIGEYTNIPIALTRSVKNGESFTAMIHEDNGDRTFSIVDDGVYRNEEENSIFTQIFIQDIIPPNSLITP